MCLKKQVHCITLIYNKAQRLCRLIITEKTEKRVRADVLKSGMVALKMTHGNYTVYSEFIEIKNPMQYILIFLVFSFYFIIIQSVYDRILYFDTCTLHIFFYV